MKYASALVLGQTPGPRAVIPELNHIKMQGLSQSYLTLINSGSVQIV